MQTTPMMGMRMSIYRPFHTRSDVSDACPRKRLGTDTMTQSEGTKKIGAPARDRGSGLRQ